MAKPFQFTLQPALDAAIAERVEWERTVTETRAELARQQQRFTAIDKELNELTQRLRETGDNLANVESSPRDYASLAAETAGLTTLRNRQVRHRNMLLQQARLLRDIHDKLTLQQENLKKAWSKVKSLEKLRERQLQDFETELERAEQDDIDEAAIQRFNRE